jgi:hypothetical protein
MVVSELATISFRDGDTGESAVMIVRQCDRSLALAISLQGDGDMQVLLDAASAEKLANALKKGIEKIERISD